MAQQTAVDYLIEQLDEQVYRIDHKDNRINISISYEDMMTLKKQAKQMEKKQILDAICANQNGLLRRKTVLEAMEYYKEIYGGQGSPDTSPNTQK